MRTLHFGVRVADLDRSLGFYTALGYERASAASPRPPSDTWSGRCPARVSGEASRERGPVRAVKDSPIAIHAHMPAGHELVAGLPAFAMVHAG